MSEPVKGTPDKIFVSAIDCIAAVGVTPEERTMRQRLSVDVEVATDIREAVRTDSLGSALDYSRIVSLVVNLAGSRDYNLIETLASHIANRILADLGGNSVRVVVRKSPPPMAAAVGFVSVEILRGR